MIVFDLACANGHRFEGWFADGEDFAAQQARGLVTCPACGDGAVRRVPSAVHVATPSPPPRHSARAPDTPPPSPLALAKALLDAAVASSEDVGREFAREARRIHYQESPARNIRGQASPDEVEALHDEGIPVMSLPSLRPEDLN